MQILWALTFLFLILSFIFPSLEPYYGDVVYITMGVIPFCWIIFSVFFDESETTSSNAGDYWASDYGGDGGFGE